MMFTTLLITMRKPRGELSKTKLLSGNDTVAVSARDHADLPVPAPCEKIP